MKFFFFLALFFFLLALFFFCFQFLISRKNILVLEKNICNNPRFCVLIPARDESFVIRKLLESILRQTRKVFMQDVYVIVEDMEDPTVQICEEYGAKVIIRKHLNLKSKGYALAEAVEFLEEKQKFYDAYFIMDADNVLDEHYFEEMEYDYLQGYAISTGYRSYKNANASIVSSAAGVIYTFMNEWINKVNMKYQKNLMLSGTGFYIHGDYIQKWKTYPFHSLCEDVELSYYATLHGLSMHYNSRAIFYDEQPTSMRVSIKQRKRWVRGYFNNWFSSIPIFLKVSKINKPNSGSIWDMTLGILPIIFLVLSFLFFGTFLILSQAYWSFFYLFLLIYLFLALGTFCILVWERKKLGMSLSMMFCTIWYHPFFLMTYLWVVLLAIVQRDMQWDKIPHGNTKK